jgi:hypothetical protein
VIASIMGPCEAALGVYPEIHPDNPEKKNSALFCTANIPFAGKTLKIEWKFPIVMTTTEVCHYSRRGLYKRLVQIPLPLSFATIYIGT